MELQSHVLLPLLGAHTEDRHRGSVGQVSLAHHSEHLDPGGLTLALPPHWPVQPPDVAAGEVGVRPHRP